MADVDRYCPRCAGELAAFEEDGHARQRCAKCGRIHYRNSKPAVTGIVARGGRVLLSRRAREPHLGLWDLPGGFLESGEHPEDGLRREILEETGLHARVGRLVTIAVGTWAEFDTLNLIYEAEADGEPRAMDDSIEMRFFAINELPEMAFPHEREALLAWAQSSRSRGKGPIDAER